MRQIADEYDVLRDEDVPLTTSAQSGSQDASADPAPHVPSHSSYGSVYLPEKDLPELCIAFMLLIFTALYLCLFRRYTSLEPDEGILLQGAQRVLGGEVLYRDFFSFFTPGSYYSLALLFKVFGNSLQVARTELAVFGGFYSAISYLLARRVCSRGTALSVAAIVALATIPYRFEVLHNWDSTLWACLTVYCAVRCLESIQLNFPGWKWAFATGSLASLTFLSEQSKGAGLILGLGFGFLALALVGAQRLKWKTSQVLGLAVGLAWPALATLAYFAGQHGLSVMLADWFWPLGHYSLANRVPYGYQNWSEAARHQLFGAGSLGVRLITVVALSPCFLVPVLPLIAVGLLAYWMILTKRGRAPREIGPHYVLVCAALSGLLLSVVVGRADVIHFMYLLPLFSLVLGWLIEGRDIPVRIFKTIRPIFNAYIAIAFLLFAMPLLLRAINAPVRVLTRRGMISTPADDTVIPYLQAHAASGETILVYPYLPLYYYLTDTRSPGRYEYFQPGMHTPQQAGEMIAELSAERTRVVLFEASFWEKVPTAWPRTPLAAIAQDPVADYIMREYRSCKNLKSASEGRFLFMVRKDVACP